MTVFLISYDLKQDKNYLLLYEFMHKHQAIKILKSVYILKTDKNIEYLRGSLDVYTDSDDEYLITEITANYFSNTESKEAKKIASFFE